MAGFTKGRTKSKRSTIEPLDYHEGFSANQIKIVLREFGLLDKLDKFNEFMFGQTCPIIQRHDRNTGKIIETGGVYEYDLFRWIKNQKEGTTLIWD